MGADIHIPGLPFYKCTRMVKVVAHTYFCTQLLLSAHLASSRDRVKMEPWAVLATVVCGLILLIPFIVHRVRYVDSCV